MKKLIILFLIFSANIIFAEMITITKAQGRFGVFDTNHGSFFKIGAKYQLYRFFENKESYVGLIEIVKIQDSKVGVKLKNTSSYNEIEIGDYFHINFSPKKPYSFLKFGIKGYSGIIDTCHINTMVNKWIEDVVVASDAELENEPTFLPFNVEYGYQPFIIIRPARFLQIGVKMDYAFSNVIGKFENPLMVKDYEFNFEMKSYVPCIFSYLTLGKLELGGGIFHAYTHIDANDNFFGYKDTWFGNNTGYEVNIGYSSSMENILGFTMGIRYRDLLIKSLEDNYNRKITFSETHKNLSLKMSGFFFEMGFYFQFIKTGKY